MRAFEFDAGAFLRYTVSRVPPSIPDEFMNWKRPMSLLSAAAWLIALSAVGQTNVNSTSQPTVNGQVVVPEKLTATDVSPASNLRPPRPERQNLPPEVQERLNRFRGAARDYLEKREALKKQLQGANDKERAAIRDSMKQLREQWLDQAREMRKEFRDRAVELRNAIPELDEVLQSARDAALEQSQNSRPRPGEERP